MLREEASPVVLHQGLVKPGQPWLRMTLNLPSSCLPGLGLQVCASRAEDRTRGSACDAGTDPPHYSPSPDRGVQGLLLIFRQLNNNSEQSLCCLDLLIPQRPAKGEKLAGTSGFG